MSFFNRVIDRFSTTPPWSNHPGTSGMLIKGIRSFRTHNFLVTDPQMEVANNKRKLKDRIDHVSPEGKKRRVVSHYKNDNFSIGNKIQRNIVKELKEQEADNNCFGDISTLSPELLRNIKYHVMMRHWSLFFLLCVYKGEQCGIWLNNTEAQDGSSNCGCCEGAHSCPTPNVRDSLSNTNRISKDKSFMYRLMNAVTQLYFPFNDYDKGFESRLRPVAIRLMNVVSGIKLVDEEKPKSFDQSLPDLDTAKDVVDAVNKFIQWERAFFKYSEPSIQKKYALLKELEVAEQNLYQVEKKKSDLKTYLVAIELFLEKKAEYVKRDGFIAEIDIGHRMKHHLPIFSWIKNYYQEARVKDDAKLNKMILQWLDWIEKNDTPQNRKIDAVKKKSMLKQSPQTVFNSILKEYTLAEILDIFGGKEDLQKVIQNTLEQCEDWKPLSIENDLKYLDTLVVAKNQYEMNTTAFKVDNFIVHSKFMQQTLLAYKTSENYKECSLQFLENLREKVWKPLHPIQDDSQKLEKLVQLLKQELLQEMK